MQYDNIYRNIFQTSIPNQEHKYVDSACDKQTLKKSELWDLESIDGCNGKPWYKKYIFKVYLTIRIVSWVENACEAFQVQEGTE